MTKDNAAKYLPFVQALAGGKVIQVKSGHGDAPLWKDLEVCNFNVSPELYRVKPEPREWWITQDYLGNVQSSHDSRHSAIHWASAHILQKVVHVREVIE